MNKRFFKYIEKKNYCWEWKGGKTGSGYGAAYIKGKQISSHRLSYIIHKGPIKNGLDILHKCDNKICVNPDHLWQGTPKQNSEDMMKKGRGPHPNHQGEKCPNHKLTEKDIKEIWAMDLKRGNPKIRKKYGVCQSYFHKIIHKKCWTHLL